MLNLCLLLVRLVAGYAFLAEFALKAPNIRKFAKNDGLPVPAAWGVTIAELMAAAGFVSGVLTRPAALGVMALMAGTICLHIFKWHSPYRAGRGGWEYDLMLFTFALVLWTFGPGQYVISL